VVVSRNLNALGKAVMVLLTVLASQAIALDMECLTCHSAPGFRAESASGKPVSLHVDANEILGSVHASQDCVDCHSDLRNKPLPHPSGVKPVQCTRCHHRGNAELAPDTMHIETFADSVHGTAARGGDPDAPQCKTCHGTHGILKPSNPKSSVFRAKVPATCGSCHFDKGFAKRHGVRNVSRYKDSVHAITVAGHGRGPAAVCTDCHGVHDIMIANAPASRVSKQRMPQTCGKCHADVFRQYSESVHGRALAKGAPDAPACSDCHGEHTIQKPSTASSSVSPGHIVATCSKCHENMRIQRDYGLPANRLASYIDSYHGINYQLGNVTVANCSTCHGAHLILPSSDPRSSVNKNNLSKTCDKCHPGASQNFAKASIHVFPSKSKDAVVYWVALLYGVFVWGLIGSFCVYILLDLRARKAGRLPGRKNGAKP
jgi:hypothetical protein